MYRKSRELLRKEAKERTRRTLEDETRTFVLKTLKKVGGKARVFAVNGYALCSNGNVTYYEEDYERAKVNAVGICTKAFYLYHMEDANYDFFGVDKRESVINFFHKKMFVQHPEIKKANQVTQKELSEKDKMLETVISLYKDDILIHFSIYQVTLHCALIQ